MKKNSILFALILASTLSYSQLERGRSMAAAAINFNNSSGKNYIENESIGAEFERFGIGGYLVAGNFVRDNLLIGLGANYNFNNQNTTNYAYLPDYQTNSREYRHTIMPNVFCRFYKLLGNSKFAVFGQANAGYSLMVSETEYSSTQQGATEPQKTKSINHAIQVSLTPGITYFFTNKFAVECAFGHLGFGSGWSKIMNNEGQVTRTEKSTGFNSTMIVSLSTIHVGFSFYFGKPKV